jgi:hypothetical protein
MMKKSFLNLTPGSNVVQYVTTVDYKCSQKTRLFVPGKLFQPSVMSVASLKGAYFGRPWYYSQELEDYA